MWKFLRNWWVEKEYAGLDISDRSCEFLILGRGASDFFIKFRKRIEIPPGIIERGVILEKKKLLEFLTALFLASGLRRVSLVITLGFGEPQAFLKSISFESGSSILSLREAVLREAAKSVPITMSEFQCDYLVMQGPPHYEALFFAVRKNVLADYREILEEAGVSDIIAEPEALALLRSVVTRGDFENGAALLVDFGARNTSFYLVDENKLKVAAGIPYGSDEMNAALSKRLEISLEEAEQKKKSLGFLDENLFMILQYVPQLIIREIGRISDFYADTSGGRIGKIILVGGGALLPGIHEYFNVNLGKPVMRIRVGNDILYYSVAAGLALRGLMRQEGLNLFMPRT